MTERVTEVDLGVTWEPNDPDAVLVTNGFKAVLSLKAHFDDRDQRCVVLVWTRVTMARLGSPGDETISGHHLYNRGLSDVMWAGRVQGSELIADLERENSVHPAHDPARYDSLTHFVVVTKDDLAEVVAEAIAVERIDGSTLDAATAAIRR